jgi:hypothetical protein
MTISAAGTLTEGAGKCQPCGDPDSLALKISEILPEVETVRRRPEGWENSAFLFANNQVVRVGVPCGGIA